MAEVHRYPDVLNAITGGARHEMDTLQCAVGVYPGQTMLGQPFEVLVLLQSKINVPQEVAVMLQLPVRDSSGRRLSFFVPRKEVRLKLSPGEVGLLHLPVVAQPPTPPAPNYPLLVRILARAPKEFSFVRDPGTGRPPSVFNISPFRLDVLRDIGFCADGKVGVLRCRFAVMSGRLPPGTIETAAHYETLWQAEEFELEREQLELAQGKAERLALDFTVGTVLLEVEQQTNDVYAAAGLPLHPAEAHFIAKSITYVMDSAYQYEPDFDLHNARWFQWLCSVIMQDERALDRPPGDLAMRELYFGALYDAVVVTLPMVEIALGETFGTPEEHRRYAEALVRAVQGLEPIDLLHAYLPLVMGGVLLNMRIRLREEDLWGPLDDLVEAQRGRTRLHSRENNAVLNGLNRLIAEAQDELRRSRIPRQDEY
ncbi:MAG: hypothetical protein Kow0077_27530 [Anaerolineae bacterium]